MFKSTAKRVALGLAIVMLAACSDSGSKHQAQSVIVSTVTAKTMPMPNRIVASGTIEASATVVLKSLVDGQIKAVLFNEGDHVKEGQPLFLIDDSIIRAQLAASVAQKGKDIALADQAQAEFLRQQELQKRGNASKSALDAAEAQARAAQEASKADQAQIDQLNAQLVRYTITAPVDGRTGESLIKPGAIVKANDTTGLVTVNRISPVRVRFPVPAYAVASVRDHFKANDSVVMARLHGDTAAPAKGRLAFIDNAVDTATGQLLAKGEFPNEDESLLPGALADVTLDVGQPKPMVAIPETALQLGQDKNYVYVAAADNTAQQRDVEIAGRIDGTVYVSKGVADGDKVVVDGASRLAPGMALTVKDNDAPASKAPATVGAAGGVTGSALAGASQ